MERSRNAIVVAWDRIGNSKVVMGGRRDGSRMAEGRAWRTKVVVRRDDGRKAARLIV
jgi:hypothetical protein